MDNTFSSYDLQKKYETHLAFVICRKFPQYCKIVPLYVQIEQFMGLE